MIDALNELAGQRYVPSDTFLIAHLGGDPEQVVFWLKEAQDRLECDGTCQRVGAHPDHSMFDSVRGHARFQALINN